MTSTVILRKSKEKNDTQFDSVSEISNKIEIRREQHQQ